MFLVGLPREDRSLGPRPRDWPRPRPRFGGRPRPRPLSPRLLGGVKTGDLGVGSGSGVGELLTRIRREGLGGGRDSSDSNAESSTTLVPEFELYSVIATASNSFSMVIG